MYDELVKRLRTECTLPFQTLQLMHEAADAIEELSAAVEGYESSTSMALVEKDGETVIEFVPKWIPVTERLPPAKKEVYVTDGEYIARANLLDDVFPGDKPCWSYSGLGEITHWCEHIPLPQPPKEE